MPPPRVAVVGSANVDLTFRTARLPRPGETLTGQAFQLSHGGKGANQAVMAARFGAQVTLLAKVGGDLFGDGLVRQLETEGIDTRHIHRATEQASGVAGIVVDDDAQNCIIVVPGANDALTPEEVRQAAPTLHAAAVLLCQLEVPLATTHEALRLAKTAGVRTILNPAPAQPLPDDLLALADFCIPNETELALLTKRPVTTTAEIEAAARELHRRGPGTVLVTLGARGVFIWSEQTATHLPAFAVTAVDTTGAGDAFIGALAVLLAEGASLEEAARHACAAAALSVTRPGAQASFPSRDEVRGWMGKMYAPAADG